MEGTQNLDLGVKVSITNLKIVSLFSP